jgi:hypothetical protein
LAQNGLVLSILWNGVEPSSLAETAEGDHPPGTAATSNAHLVVYKTPVPLLGHKQGAVQAWAVREKSLEQGPEECETVRKNTFSQY